MIGYGRGGTAASFSGSPQYLPLAAELAVPVRLDQAMARSLELGRSALDNFAGRLNSHAERHDSLLARGYVVVRKPAPFETPLSDSRRAGGGSSGAGEAAAIVTAAADIAPGAALELEFHDGKLAVTAAGAPGLSARKRGTPRRRPGADPPAQGSLFG